MERIVPHFVSFLRENGIRVSPSETLDAVQALAFGGIAGRRSTRRLLRLTLVKNVNDIGRFNTLFNLFFRSFRPELTREKLDELLDVSTIDMDGEFTYLNQQVSDDHDEPGPLIKLDSDINPEDMQDLKSLTEIDPDDSDGQEIMVQLKGFRGKGKAPRPTRKFVQNPLTIELDKSNFIQNEVAFTPEEQASMQDVVSRMMMRLRKDMKRMKNAQNRGKLHVIKTIQKNYRHDMIPFQLALKRKRREKPRLVILCDVSFSVSHASRFMLLLLHTLQNQMLDVRSFIFNREVVEITDMLANMPVNDLMKNIDAGELLDMDANSSYGEVLLDFKKKYLQNLRGRPAFIFLGDGRNNYDVAHDEILYEIREKARYMLWLTPEEREDWLRGDCMINTYGAYCNKVETVRTVEELSCVVEDLLRDIYADRAEPIDVEAIKNAKKSDDVDYWNYYSKGLDGALKADSAPPDNIRWIDNNYFRTDSPA